ncbi:uncharacterized protein [Neodiprion pinetum]|uniref:Uncharacterized protein LOC107219589 n=1 Tax=Neodiprion lecontei TaxID=441921 RepID=A0A6J0BGN9_NEOLC|nr:uncharacterized protein LOC107219589 [Neodiprion lecontei]XP_046488001.1 uncharacterized protein LOC124221761 [Neodiprion pinetum]XP_046624751.1 uncharacterized protein LOC124307275 [Neodiprion virginianus]
MSGLWRVFLVACLLEACLSHPAKEQAGKMYVSKTKMSDLESSASGYVYKNLPASKYAEIINEGLREFEEAPAAAPAKKSAKKEFVLLPSIQLEPDAEMLPAHYTRVEPPGVDHMEISFQDPEALDSYRSSLIEGTPEADAAPAAYAKTGEFQEGAGKQFAAEKHVAEGKKGEKGFKKAEEFEEAVKGEHDNANHKGSYAEAAGKKKAYDETEKHYAGHKDSAEADKGASYELEGHHEKGHNNAGFHNVYHKDEYKKDSDFYDKDHRGGKFRKHGHYGEKHTSAEGGFKKGGNHDSGYAEADEAREGEFAKGHEREAKKGHAAKQGYGGFFGNFEEFAKKGGAVEAKKYGFSSGDNAKESR